MEHITDCKITKVYEGPSGESKFKDGDPWQIYNIYTDKSEHKLTWIGGPKKWVPKERAPVKHIGYEIETKGEYTNYQIKELDLNPIFAHRDGAVAVDARIILEES